MKFMRDKKKRIIICTAIGALTLGIASPLLITNAQDGLKNLDSKDNQKIEQKTSEVKTVNTIETKTSESVKIDDSKKIESMESKTEDKSIEEKKKQEDQEARQRDKKLEEEKKQNELKKQEEERKAEEKRVQEEAKRAEERRTEEEKQSKKSPERCEVEARADFVDYNYNRVFGDHKMYCFNYIKDSDPNDFDSMLADSAIPKNERVSFEEARSILLSTDLGISFDSSKLYSRIPAVYRDFYQFDTYNSNYDYTGYRIIVRHDGKEIQVLHMLSGNEIKHIYR